MKYMLFALIFIAGQAITMQDKPVIHLKPHSNTIDPAFRGSLVELSNAPATVYLPASPPAPVTIVSKQNFNTTISVNQTIHILANGQS